MTDIYDNSEDAQNYGHTDSGGNKDLDRLWDETVVPASKSSSMDSSGCGCAIGCLVVVIIITVIICYLTSK